ncbi:MAG TPA: hypothetical protein VKZ82_04735 [Nonomuraea sp.]|uniref:hypothetical protein n=1 Tax=Nonomuraea sp. NPDC049649 TaxID=3155776 RepID=UPI002CC96A8C|nr:hypothetical protein [Nonomuraea sp.]
MKKTGLILAGLIGGMVMLGSAPALAEGYTTAPVFASGHDDDVDIDNSRRVEQKVEQRNNQEQDVDVNVFVRQDQEVEEEGGYTGPGGLAGLIEAIGGVLGGGGGAAAPLVP